MNRMAIVKGGNLNFEDFLSKFENMDIIKVKIRTTIRGNLSE